MNQKVIGEAEATILNDALTQVMILMPQSLAGVEVKVTYSAEKGGLEVHSASEPVTVKLTGNWEAGSKTAYVLSLNGDAINDRSSDDTSWSEKTDVNTDVNEIIWTYLLRNKCLCYFENKIFRGLSSVIFR